MRRRWATFVLTASVAAGAATGGSDVANSGSSTAARSMTSVDDSLARRIASLQRREHALRNELERDQRELERLHQRIVARGRVYYRLARGGPTEGGIIDHAVKLERVRRALLRDMQRSEELVQSRRQKNAELAEVADRKAPLLAQQAEIGVVREALLSRQERELAFQQAFASERAAPHTAIYSAGVGPSAPIGLSDGFGAMRGRLPFPLPGRAEVEEVRRRWADGPGLLMRGRPGTAVRAVYGGRIAFADVYADYGQTIIIDHGQGYFSVSANLAAIEVRVGDDVPAGSRLGTVGESGGRGELYFEIRKGIETLRPGEWFGI